MKDCIFCKIIKKEVPATILYETNSTLAIAPNKPESKGHLLIIPRKHYENIFDIQKTEFQNYTKTLQEICIKLKNNYKAQGINILNANGKAAQQSVQHLHFHLIPRFENDEVDAWPKFKYEEKNREKTYEEIKQALK